jgi:hypothetical protein
MSKGIWMAGLKALAAGGFLAAILLVPTQAKALSFTLNTTFNGAPPTSTPPYLTAVFANAGANTVTLTLTSSLETPSEFISDVAFNVNPSIIPNSLTITEGSHSGSGPATIDAAAQDAQKLKGGGSAGFGFDVNISFPPDAPSSNRFDDSDVAVFTLTGTGLTENDFNFTNTGSADAHIAAHIQGIPVGDSGAVKDGPPSTQVVPEPSTWLLLITGSVFIFGYGWRRRRSA